MDPVGFILTTPNWSKDAIALLSITSTLLWIGDPYEVVLGISNYNNAILFALTPKTSNAPDCAVNLTGIYPIFQHEPSITMFNSSQDIYPIQPNTQYYLIIGPTFTTKSLLLTVSFRLTDKTGNPITSLPGTIKLSPEENTGDSSNGSGTNSEDSENSEEESEESQDHRRRLASWLIFLAILFALSMGIIVVYYFNRRNMYISL